MSVSPLFMRHVLALAITLSLVSCHSENSDSTLAVIPSAEPVYRGPETVTELNSSITNAGTGNQPQAQVKQAQTPVATLVNPQPIAAMDAGQLMPAGSRVRGWQEYSHPAEQQSAMHEVYADLNDNAVHSVLADPVSTFSIDVDTGAYSNVRRFLNQGQLPPPDAVRAEELINYFSYNYPANTGDTPFSAYTEIAASPWNSGKHLLQIGIQAQQPGASAEQPDCNLVFLVDVSGSMQSPDKLDLLVSSLKLLTRQLDETDSIAIVVYAGASGVALDATSGKDKRAIMAALDQLQAGGSTNGAAGIMQAYAIAEQHFIASGINRVLLATDGDFNVGLTDFQSLVALIEDKRKSGISLTTLGFGSGNYNDQLMEQLADAGNGNYAYIDTLNEARKVLVDELSATLQTVASDVKIQIEFNPAVVSEYRLVGYENRVLATEDFNNDKVDAGEIGAGHSVTALYEITLRNSAAGSIDPLRYQQDAAPVLQAPALDAEVAFLKLRYKPPGSDSSVLLQKAIAVSTIKSDLQDASDDYRFAAAVAGFSQLLRHNKAMGEVDFQSVLALAGQAWGDDIFGYRSEFLNLVKTAQALAQN